MNLEFFVEAQIELGATVDFYNRQRDGLGDEFADEVEQAITRIMQYPDAWSLVSKRTRRCRMSRFPNGILYQVRGETLVIIAVTHLRREPQSWRSRLGRDEA
jgi:toxin ParE1/3/4